jgi:hypothetical protein
MGGMMGDDQVPASAGSVHPLIKFVQDLGLPAALSNSAIGAIHRLVTGLADYPAAWLGRASQQVKNGTEARKQLSAELAKAAASTAVGDPELVERAVAAWLPEAVRKQTNREAVARAAVEHIRDDPISGSGCVEQDLNPDWMNAFVRHAEDASTDRMRDLWGRVLAGELRKPGAFSLRTVRFMAELDAKVGQAFERISKYVVDGDNVMLSGNHKGEMLDDILLLNEAGLLSGLINTSFTFNIPEDGCGIVVARDKCAVVYGEPGALIRLECIFLTEVGAQMYGILSLNDQEFTCRLLADKIQKPGIQRIELAKVDANGFTPLGETLWARE